MMRLLLMGPPGAGKGTQASIIAERYGIPAISTGDLFRNNVARGTDLGREAERYMNAGEYVPDDVTNAMLRDRLLEPDAEKGFLLDGYPRTLAQVEFLDSVLEEQGVSLDRVVELVVDVDEVVSRLLARAAAEGRKDDTEEVVRRRLEVYAEETAPLLELYDSRGLLIRVDGVGTVEEVANRITASLA